MTKKYESRRAYMRRYMAKKRAANPEPYRQYMKEFMSRVRISNPLMYRTYHRRYRRIRMLMDAGFAARQRFYRRKNKVEANRITIQYLNINCSHEEQEKN